MYAAALYDEGGGAGGASLGGCGSNLYSGGMRAAILATLLELKQEPIIIAARPTSRA